eukprot:TRINITY_DN5277_c0_g1_i3.p1 TRINITY_DN5277_c0_g1~~TRINITY_DN5277_c0_g1_i3.p1  ORF type:complete len:155 (+),score=34.70 TRINITY_DN5277_c0_g1_i3:533-997(+)
MDKISTVSDLKRSISKLRIDPESYPTFFKCLLVRFSSNGKIIPHDCHQLGHLSVCAAKFIKDTFQPKLVAVQAPSFDRAECRKCDVHRVFFDLEVEPLQTQLNGAQEPSQVLLGENFEFQNIDDGFYLMEVGGIDMKGLDVVLSSSYVYHISEV